MFSGVTAAILHRRAYRYQRRPKRYLVSLHIVKCASLGVAADLKLLIISPGLAFAKYVVKQICLFILDPNCSKWSSSKVRSLWSAIDEMLSTTKDGQNAVECVLKGDVDQFVLDGTDHGFKVPQCLLQRIEQLPHQVRVNISCWIVKFL